jgi:AcrR family transcriptional regulator
MTCRSAGASWSDLWPHQPGAASRYCGQVTALPSMRKVQAEATRARLLEAACQAFTERTFDEVSVTDIAEAAGTAHGLIFHYFGSKRGLYLEALRDVARQLQTAYKVPAEATGVEAWHAMLRCHLEFMAEHPRFASALMHGGIGADPEARQIFDEVRRTSGAWFRELFDLDDADPTLSFVLSAVTGAIDEATFRWLQPPALASLDDVIVLVHEILLGALRACEALEPAFTIPEKLLASSALVKQSRPWRRSSPTLAKTQTTSRRI